MIRQNVLILGSSGMLGHVLYSVLIQEQGLSVFGTVRKRSGAADSFTRLMLDNLIDSVDANDFESVSKAVDAVQPTVIINCIGVIKQLPIAADPLHTIPINSLFPHRLARMCQKSDIRLIHISTDCVFDGAHSGYKEDSPVSASDLYGLSKFLGEVSGPGLVTLRTSIIGHEMSCRYGLLEWFLSQNERVNGFTKAVFSGFPAIELSRIIRDFVLVDPALEGLYHVSSNAITKDELLRLIADVYHKKISIEPNDQFICDRSLDSTRFRQATGYVPPAWPDLVQAMHNDFLNSPVYAERRRL